MIAALAVALAVLAAPGPAAACPPQVHLTGTDLPLLFEVADALRSRGIRTWTNDEPGDSEWGCADLAVALETREQQIVLATTDGQGRARTRTVRARATAVALVESWLLTEPTTELYGAPATWALSVRGEGAGSNDASWLVGAGLTLARRFGFVIHGEVTARVAGGSQQVFVNDEFFGSSVGPEGRTSIELVAGAALRWDLGALSLWAGAGGGARVLTGAYESASPLLEPLVAMTVPVAFDVELELRATAQFLVPDGPSQIEDAWWVLRGGLGVRWGL